jgi:4-oxalocrotonate tautomerase
MFEEVAADFVANGGVLASEDASRAGVLSRLARDAG